MLKSADKTGTNEFTVALSISAEEFEAAIVKAFNKEKRNITVPGFRKGKAPRAIIEKRYGESVFYDEALEIAFPDVYGQAIDEAGLEPVDNPRDLDIKSIGKDGVDLVCKVTVKPEIKISDYKGLSAVKLPTEVTDEEVEAELLRRRENSARLIDVEGREVKSGDIAVIDFEGFMDGVAFEGGKGENHELEIGSGSFIPGFEDQIIGHNAGDEFDVNVTFPEDYAEELAGKPAVFKVKVNAIKEKELPEANDEFAKDVSEFDTLDEFKADLRKTLEEQKKATSDKGFENEIFDKLAGLVDAEIPDAMIERATDNMIQEFRYNVESQGLPFEQYLGYLGMNIDTLKTTYADRAEKDVKVELALEKIVELEKIEVTDEEVENELKTVADKYKTDIETVKKAILPETVKKELAARKASDFIIDNAVAEDAPAEEEKAAPKKKAAKKTTTKKTTKTTAKKTTKKKAEEAPAEETAE